MSEQDYADLLNRAVGILRETYVNPNQPWSWPRRELRVQKGYTPDAILVHGENSHPGRLEAEDALVHGIIVCSEACALHSVDEDEEISFPLIEDMAKMPCNYRWLAIPEDLDIDEEIMDSLLEECSRRGIGIIMCYMDEDYDEIYLEADVVDGEFLTTYSESSGILQTLSERLRELPPIQPFKEDEEEEYDYELSDWNSSGDYD